ncbi:MAG TPA: hypothetical protein VIZ43_14915 [Trebonia sp.]
MTQQQDPATDGRPVEAEPGQGTLMVWQSLWPLMDLVTPMALRVAATLRLADFMPDDGTGQATALGDLAERAGAAPEQAAAGEQAVLAE